MLMRLGNLQKITIALMTLAGAAQVLPAQSRAKLRFPSARIGLS